MSDSDTYSLFKELAIAADRHINSRIGDFDDFWIPDRECDQSNAQKEQLRMSDQEFVQSLEHLDQCLSLCLNVTDNLILRPLIPRSKFVCTFGRTMHEALILCVKTLLESRGKPIAEVRKQWRSKIPDWRVSDLDEVLSHLWNEQSPSMPSTMQLSIPSPFPDDRHGTTGVSSTTNRLTEHGSGMSTEAERRQPALLSDEFWDNATPFLKAIMRLLLKAPDYRVTRRVLEHSKQCFRSDTPPRGTVIKALNRLQQLLTNYGNGWSLHRSSEMDSFDAEIWLRPPVQ